MKLCNDCDLNYRQSKNKRLLVELTLIQLAQITSEEDDISNGRSPKVIKPIFNQQTAPVATQQQPVAQQQPITQQPAIVQSVQQPVQQNTSEPQPQYGNNAAQQQVHKLPDGLKVTQEKKIPVVKAGILGPSIKRKPQHQEESTAQKPAAQVQQAEKEWEDYDVYEKDLNYYWREFATRLPKEERANAGRMMNMSPKLLDDQTTFEVAVDNSLQPCGTFPDDEQEKS